MPGDRFVVLGLAPARAPWFAAVAGWADSGALPVEFVKCVSVDELRARVASGRRFSAILVDGSAPGVDRDLFDEASRGGGRVIVVSDRRVDRDWIGLGAAAVLDAAVDRRGLGDALGTHAARVVRGGLRPPPATPNGAPEWRGLLVAVTGPGGTGASVLAMALAESLAGDARHGGMVVLADCALHADQALLHDAGDVVPGLPELVQAHRFGQPTFDEIRGLTFSVARRGYHLMLGLRRHRDWVTIRPRAFGAALDGLRLAFRAVVADIDPDVEGYADTGSADVEERNAIARTVTSAADAVLVVGHPGAKGTTRMARTVAALIDHGVAPERLVLIVNRAPKGPRRRAELTATTAMLMASHAPGTAVAPPVFVAERRHIDDLIHDGARLPPEVGATVLGAVEAALQRASHLAPSGAAVSDQGVAVAPGSLGLRA